MNKSEAEILRPNILIVDDTLENLQLMSNMLAEKGYSVTGAPDGTTALMIAENEPPDLILLDIRMPKMDGYEVCARLKSYPKTQNIPVIFLSALDELQDKIKGFSLGGADYVTKPFREEEVLARVNTHISLRRAQKRLEDHNVLLEKEINERRKAEDALKKANNELESRVRDRTAELLKAKDEAEAASRAKTEFLSNISHEFRTPLNPIIGMADVMLHDFQPGSEQYEGLKTISICGKQILSMVENLIQLSRIEAEGICPQTEPLEIRPFMRSAAVNLLFDARPKGLKVRHEIDHEVPDQIFTDSELLLNILEQLGKNAVKFTKQGEIVLSVRQNAENETVFSVRDTGVGIPAARLENIFEDFTQADTGYSRRYSGMGLGLTMVRKILKAMCGRIWVESQEGKGSCFYFTVRGQG